MSRYTGPKCRLCRREGVKLFLKGSRCETEKCALTRKQSTPGQVPTGIRLSEFADRLREKQKVKRIYGVSERQFKNYVKKAQLSKGETGSVLLRNLELRLDSVVYRLGLALSRAHARQLVRTGKFLVNGKEVNIPSFAVKEGDIISPSNGLGRVREENLAWLSWDEKKKVGKVVRVPERSELDPNINEGLIVEFYSR